MNPIAWTSTCLTGVAEAMDNGQARIPCFKMELPTG